MGEHQSSLSAIGPLAGLRVLALEQAVAGPLGSRHLADEGADAIQVVSLEITQVMCRERSPPDARDAGARRAA